MLVKEKPVFRFLHREGSQDAEVFKSVLVNNEYRLPDKLDPADVIVDVGAHIGAFTSACLLRGAGRVFAFEPDADNFKFLQKNLAYFKSGAHPISAAVWGWPIPENLTFSGYPDGANACGTMLPGATVNNVNGNIPVTVISFDDVVTQALAMGQVETLRLVKLDCEGAEYPILTSSKMLRSIDEIVGETHDIPAALIDGVKVPFGDTMTLKGFLEAAGFRVELKRSSITHQMWNFWAKRR